MTVGPGAASVPANGDAQIFDNFDPGDPARIFLGRRGFLVFGARPPVWAGPINSRKARALWHTGCAHRQQLPPGAQVLM